MTKLQCVVSVCMWFLASLAIVVGLEGMGINKLFYGLICWLAPIICKPIADTVSVRASPFTEKVLRSIEKLIQSKVKNQE